MITELTPEQKSKLDDYYKKWVDIGLNTDPCDFESAKKACKMAYELVGLTPPKTYYLADCPVSAAILAARLKKNKMDYEPTNNEIYECFCEQIFGFQEVWLSFYDYFRNEIPEVDIKIIDGLVEMAKCCGWWAPYSEVAIFQHRPTAIHRDNQNRLHNENGPAVEYRGNKTKVYFVHGVRVTENIVNKNFTVNDIEDEENVEVRRIMIDIYGKDRYIRDSGMKPIAMDDFGELYTKPQKNDVPLMMVKVVNSTPEADGTFKDYWIRVDPQAYGGITTPHQAVASTFRNKDGSLLFKDWKDYDPEVQT